MPDTPHIPTDDEIQEAARQLSAGGFNDEDPGLAAHANRLVAQAGTQGGQVVRRIAHAAAEQGRDR